MMTPMSPSVPRLDDNARWNPQVHDRLDAFLADCAQKSGSASAPFAVFDWDNTLFHGDIGDALFLYMVQHSRFFRPDHWQETTPYLTPAAIGVLVRHTPAGNDLLPGIDGIRLARELVSIYLHHRTSDGAEAFSGFDPDLTHPSYAWCASLLAGNTPGQVGILTRTVLTHLFNQPAGATDELGGISWDDWARPASPMIDLARKLEQAGVPVWIVSASPQDVVEACATAVGLSAQRVIGVRNRPAPDGRLSAQLESCGDYGSVIPYCQGKRCWIQRIIGERTDPCPGRPDDLLSDRQWFAAGDSDGDLAFLQDASRLRLVIAHCDNRSVRLAQNDEDGRWLVNPPFFGA